MQWFSCSDGKKKKVKRTCQIANEHTSAVHILENQALRTVPTKYGEVFAPNWHHAEKVDLCKSYWNPKRKMNIATHFAR